VVAGSLLERAAGIDWERLAGTHLFEKLGLRSMRYGAAAPPEGGVAVTGHEPAWFGRSRPVRFDPGEYGSRPFGAPAGFLHATVADLLRYVDFHIQGSHGRSPLLRQASFRRLHTAGGTSPYGLGWVSELTRDPRGQAVETSVHHGGYSGRARANIWFVPETQWGTVIVTNDGRGDESVTSGIFYALLREFQVVAAPSVPSAR
jgi:CubicO group peptidase (beta-lactamase class C family)